MGNVSCDVSRQQQQQRDARLPAPDSSPELHQFIALRAGPRRELTFNVRIDRYK